MTLYRKRKTNILQSQRPLSLWLLVFVFFFLGLTSLQAQYYNSGVDNSSIQWRQINTPKFQIVYPDFYETKAQKFASVLDTLYGVIGTSLKTTPPKVPFLLHTNTAYYNGLSVWAPKRIELWTTTPPTNYPYPWSWQLAIHEWRHAVQVYALKQGASKALINIFGEHIYGILVAAYIPTWFLEGDAVVAETALSPSGRGKTPDFNMYFKAQVLEKGRYSYDKALLGSMKDYVPDSYNFGYHLASFGREIYGKDIWAYMLENVGRNFWKIQTFGKSEKRGINIKTQELYNQMMDTLSKRWEEEESEKNASTYPLNSTKSISKKKKYYTNYSSPKQINDSTVVAIKTSNFNPPKLVSITKDKEENIFSLGRILHSYIDARDNHLLWSELKSHYRWEHENYSDIFEYDIQTDTYKQITFKKRYYTPAYNPNNLNIIVAIEDDSINNQHLVIIDKTNGEIIKKFFNKEGYSKFSYPSWSIDNSEIYLIKSNQYGKSIIKYNIYDEKQSLIMPPSFRNISKPLPYKDRLFFIGDYDNTYQVYSIDLKNPSSLTQHTQSRFGVMDFIIFNDSLLLSEYSADGREITLQNIINIKTTSQNPNPISFPQAEIITNQEGFILREEIIKDTLWKSQKYNKIDNLLKFHSWAPLYINVQSQDINLGVSAFSQNLLGTSVFEGGYKYLFSEKRNEYYINYTYSGWLPIINLDFKFGQRDIVIETNNNINTYSSWEEYKTGLSIDLPYSWTDKNWFKSAKYSFFYSFRSLIPRDNSEDFLTLFHTAGLGLSWSAIRAMAANDIAPQLGQTFRLKVQKSLTSDNANIIAINSSTYIPSLFNNHSFQIDFGFQKNTPIIYYFPNEIAFTSGIMGRFPEIYYGGKFSYHLPLAYPDYAIGRLLYIKRVFSRGFFDFGYFDKEYLSSIGLDLNMDFHIFRIEQELRFGIRFGYIPQLNDYFANILFNINI